MDDGEEEDGNQIEIAKMLKYNDGNDDNHINKEEIHYEMSEIDEQGKGILSKISLEGNQPNFVKRMNKPVVFVAALTFFLVVLNFALSSTVLGLTYLLVNGAPSSNVNNDLREYNIEKMLNLPLGVVCENPVLQQTFEYQLSLNPKDFISRTSEIENYTSYISSITGINLNSTNGEANVRLQYDLLTTECGNEYYIRVRNYIWGPSAGITSVDVKKSVMDKEDTCDSTLNLASAEDLVEYNFEKVEQDIHPCMRKYSRESRLFDIPFDPDLTTCGAISELFPYLFPDPAAVADVHLAHGSTTTWFTYRANGTFPTPHNMLYLIDFTLPYKTIELAKAGVTQCEPAAELSIRVWGYGQNLYNTPNTYDDLWIVNNWYNQILGQFGSWENFPCYKYGMYTSLYYD